MAINIDRFFSFQEKAIGLRTQRMEIIAGNLANANTPGYKARDIDFKAAMQSARSAQGQSLSRTHEKHFSVTSQVNSDVKFRVPDQPDTGDGNTVDAQVERNTFLDNGLRYQATVQFLDGKIKGMKKALSGGQS